MTGDRSRRAVAGAGRIVAFRAGAARAALERPSALRTARAGDAPAVIAVASGDVCVRVDFARLAEEVRFGIGGRAARIVDHASVWHRLHLVREAASQQNRHARQDLQHAPIVSRRAVNRNLPQGAAPKGER